jgi:hypothetical protein
MEDAQPVRSMRLGRSVLILKRLSVFVAITIAIYVLIESRSDGLWYFGLIWRAKGLKFGL